VKGWKDVPGFKGFYEVSSEGEVRSLHGDFPTIMKLFTESRGYKAVVLKAEGRIKRFRVHRLVLMAFIGAPEPGQQACHLNDTPSDNRLENLTWGTALENKAQARVNGGIVSCDRHGRRKVSSLDVAAIRTRVKAGESRRALAIEFGVGYQQIGNIVRGDSWGQA